MVGYELTLTTLIENLLLLEHDTIVAYDTAIERLESTDCKRQLAEFKADHDRHVRELTELAFAIWATPYRQGDAKQILTMCKVALASVVGDSTILKAMLANEDDAVTAYERASHHVDVTDDFYPVFKRALADELRHRGWISHASTL
jgi:rubrerythrin